MTKKAPTLEELNLAVADAQIAVELADTAVALAERARDEAHGELAAAQQRLRNRIDHEQATRRLERRGGVSADEFRGRILGPSEGGAG